MEILKKGLKLKLSTAAWGLYAISLIPAGNISYDSAIAMRALNNTHKQEVRATYPDFDWENIRLNAVCSKDCVGCIAFEHIPCKRARANDLKRQIELLNQISQRDSDSSRKAEIGFTLPILYASFGIMLRWILWDDLWDDRRYRRD